jgi:hypothetical protein
LQQQKISKLINQRKKHYQLLWNNVLIMNMSISLKSIHINSAKWQESSLKKKTFQKLKYLQVRRTISGWSPKFACSRIINFHKSTRYKTWMNFYMGVISRITTARISHLRQGIHFDSWKCF